MAVVMLFATSANSMIDFGILWHQSCDRTPFPWDTSLLLYASTLTCLGVGCIMGFGVGLASTGQPGNTVVRGTVYGEMRFLLTRPIRRTQVLFIPLLISTTVIVTFPAAGMLLLLAWLHLVHAPALGHLVDIARLIPSATSIGDHPGLLAVLGATHFARRYAAAVSLGMCVFTLYYVARWWVHSPYKWLRVLSVFTPALISMMPALMNFSHGHMTWLMMTSKNPSTLPSTPNIGLHLLLVAVCLGSCWKIAQEIEV